MSTMSSMFVVAAVVGNLSIGAAEALLHPNARQSCFVGQQYSPLGRGGSLQPLRAISERARTEGQQPSSSSDIIGQVDDGVVASCRPIQPAGPGVQITVPNGVVEQEFWDAFLSTDETLDRLHSLNNVICNKQQECGDDKNYSDDDAESLIDSESDVDDSESQRNDESEEDESNSDLRASLARSAILRRAGVAGGNMKQSSRSNGRSSLAKSHVDKNRRGGNQGRAIGQVLSSVRTAAAGVAGRKKLLAVTEKKNQNTDNSNHEARAARLTFANGSVASTSKWQVAVQSAVSEMLANQQQTFLPKVGELQPPPGMTSIGLLGEVIHEKFPIIPPHPGKILAEIQPKPDIPPISIRSSIPHSSDDTHIANLRLSVFSNFDAEQQQNFRRRSVEVLNVRRRRGAVVLVAEIPTEKDENLKYPNEMEARILSGRMFGEKMTKSHGLTVSPGRGVKILSVSSNVAVADRIGATSILPQNQQQKPRLSNNMIIGSVECSHHEFSGTMLGNSRPKGSLMYVTEVAVRPDNRRRGAGAALLKGVDEVAVLRNVETIYLHVDVENKAAVAMYEQMGYGHVGKSNIIVISCCIRRQEVLIFSLNSVINTIDKSEPVYAQFTESLNLHDGAMNGRKHYLMCKQLNKRKTVP